MPVTLAQVGLGGIRLWGGKSWPLEEHIPSFEEPFPRISIPSAAAALESPEAASTGCPCATPSVLSHC